MLGPLLGKYCTELTPGEKLKREQERVFVDLAVDVAPNNYTSLDSSSLSFYNILKMHILVLDVPLKSDALLDSYILALQLFLSAMCNHVIYSGSASQL